MLLWWPSLPLLPPISLPSQEAGPLDVGFHQLHLVDMSVPLAPSTQGGQTVLTHCSPPKACDMKVAMPYFMWHFVSLPCCAHFQIGQSHSKGPVEPGYWSFQKAQLCCSRASLEQRNHAGRPQGTHMTAVRTVCWPQPPAMAL